MSKYTDAQREAILADVRETLARADQEMAECQSQAIQGHRDPENSEIALPEFEDPRLRERGELAERDRQWAAKRECDAERAARAQRQPNRSETRLLTERLVVIEGLLFNIVSNVNKLGEAIADELVELRAEAADLRSRIADQKLEIAELRIAASKVAEERKHTVVDLPSIPLRGSVN
jgi:hypothetical protein